MSTDNYCETKLLIPGTSAYYAWRFTTPMYRPAWLALGTLQETLWDIVLHYREVSVAQTKLVWWAEEMARTIAGQAEHPITQALTAALPELGKVQGLLMEWIEGMMAAMICQHLCTDADFSLMAKRSIAIPALLLCRYYDLQDAKTLKVISMQSELLLFDYYLQQRQRLLSQGQVWIPLQRLHQASLNPENIGESQHAQSLKQLLSSWLHAMYQGASHLSQHTVEPPPTDEKQQHTRSYLACWQTLEKHQQALLAYPHTLTQIAHKRCERLLHNHQFTWTLPLKDITPLGKLWLAWRQ